MVWFPAFKPRHKPRLLDLRALPLKKNNNSTLTITFRRKRSFLHTSPGNILHAGRTEGPARAVSRCARGPRSRPRARRMRVTCSSRARDSRTRHAHVTRARARDPAVMAPRVFLCAASLGLFPAHKRALFLLRASVCSRLLLLLLLQRLICFVNKD